MQEILFRGKRIDNDEWVCGFVIRHKKKCYIVTFENLNYMCISHMGNASIRFLEVDPETVGCFTGLTDKNGKKIFEGDIVRNHNGGVYEFAFIKQYSRFALRRPGTVFGWSNPKLCEVIGNIHDNPELREVEK